MVGRLIATREESISLCSSGFSVCACGDAGTVRAFSLGDQDLEYAMWRGEDCSVSHWRV